MREWLASAPPEAGWRDKISVASIGARWALRRVCAGDYGRMMSTILSGSSLEEEAKRLEELSVALIHDNNWQALEQLLSPACQFVTTQGSCNRTEAIQLMKEMNLGEVRFKDFKVTQAGANLIVSFWLSASETIGGKVLPTEFSPRLSVWQRDGTSWQCIAYGDFNRV